MLKPSLKTSPTVSSGSATRALGCSSTGASTASSARSSPTPSPALPTTTARRFFAELPKTFNPRKFYPDDWAALAKLAGIRYVVFTAKHHSGFAMWPTKTTSYNITNTPFKQDIFGDVVNAFRAQGIAPGLYFSPDDF